MTPTSSHLVNIFNWKERKKWEYNTQLCHYVSKLYRRHSELQNANHLKCFKKIEKKNSNYDWIEHNSRVNCCFYWTKLMNLIKLLSLYSWLLHTVSNAFRSQMVSSFEKHTPDTYLLLFINFIYFESKCHFHVKIFSPGIGLIFSFTYPLSVIELMRTIECATLWKLILVYCFRRFFLKTVRVCARVFSITVAWTSTNPGCTSGRPIKENSSPPTRRTC